MPNQSLVPFKVVCINDSGKPESIPLSMWPEKDQVYTVTKVSLKANGYGYFLKEIQLSKAMFPYDSFGSYRFVEL